jgi:hypothetical protein
MKLRIFILAALLSLIASSVYACTYIPGLTPSAYLFWLRLSYIRMPGILFAAMFSIALTSGHGGGPFIWLLIIASLINFIVYCMVFLAFVRLRRIIIGNSRQSHDACRS